jgi:hypothetical protein
VSRIAPEFWPELAATQPTGDELRVCPPLPEISPRLLAGLDARNERRYLIRLTSEECVLNDTRSRGLSVHTQGMADENGGQASFIVVECRDVGGHELFDVIGVELAGAVATQPPAQAVSRVLAKWRRFWGQVPRSLLSREEQIGLFAEAWFLSRWLVPAAGLPASAQRWRGPFGARHDFEWTGRSVEVKGSTVVRGPVFCIHGLDQLEPPSAGELLLFGLRLREEAGAAHTLPSLLSECRTLLEADGDALGRFETALVQVGYSPVHDVDYAQTHWRVVDEKLYPVTAEFPRLTTASIPGGVPPGVSEITYTLDLGGYAGAAFATIPAANTLLH